MGLRRAGSQWRRRSRSARRFAGTTGATADDAWKPCLRVQLPCPPLPPKYLVCRDDDVGGRSLVDRQLLLARRNSDYADVLLVGGLLRPDNRWRAPRTQPLRVARPLENGPLSCRYRSVRGRDHLCDVRAKPGAQTDRPLDDADGFVALAL